MRIAVIGANGQVAQALAAQRTANAEIVLLGRPILDLAHPERLTGALTHVRPDVIINAGAFTKVDLAESAREQAFAVNDDGARAVARSAHAIGSLLLHLSTDYVFDGAQDRPYDEQDAPNPLNVYGASKLAGERAVMAETSDCAILRLSAVYSAAGANFVRTMMRLAYTDKIVRVVRDQRTRPSYAPDIAAALLRIADMMFCRREDDSLRGVFHLAADGDASWAEFAEGVFSASAAQGGPSAWVTPICSSEFAARAARPRNAVLNCAKVKSVFDVGLRPWREALPECIEAILHAERA